MYRLWTRTWWICYICWSEKLSQCLSNYRTVKTYREQGNGSILSQLRHFTLRHLYLW